MGGALKLLVPAESSDSADSWPSLKTRPPQETCHSLRQMWTSAGHRGAERTYWIPIYALMIQGKGLYLCVQTTPRVVSKCGVHNCGVGRPRPTPVIEMTTPESHPLCPLSLQTQRGRRSLSFLWPSLKTLVPHLKRSDRWDSQARCKQSHPTLTLWVGYRTGQNVQGRLIVVIARSPASPRAATRQSHPLGQLSLWPVYVLVHRLGDRVAPSNLFGGDLSARSKRV